MIQNRAVWLKRYQTNKKRNWTWESTKIAAEFLQIFYAGSNIPFWQNFQSNRVHKKAFNLALLYIFLKLTLVFMKKLSGRFKRLATSNFLVNNPPELTQLQIKPRKQ